ncbi:MAG: hypothetical protein L3J92_03810 [Thermoplasmata archaeon]|nr:hypothetical protein [Thermoplasmata archaeon]
MKCPVCLAEVPAEAPQCPSCGAVMPNALVEPVDWFPIDWIPGGAEAPHFAGRTASQRVHQFGDEVATASRSVTRRIGAAARTPAVRAYRAAKGMAEHEMDQGRAAVRRVRSRGRSVGQHVARTGRRAEGRIRSATRRAVRRVSGGPK